MQKCLNGRVCRSDLLPSGMLGYHVAEIVLLQLALLFLKLLLVPVTGGKCHTSRVVLVPRQQQGVKRWENFVRDCSLGRHGTGVKVKLAGI